VAVEDTVSTSREEEEFQLKESEYEHSSEEPEDNVNARQPTPRKAKPFQSLFELKDMASPYGGGERGVRRFSGAAGIIEIEDFKREFPCGMSSRSPAILTSTPTWCRGLCLGAWKGPRWQIMENLRLQTSLRL
jgi:hypothetical protein